MLRSASRARLTLLVVLALAASQGAGCRRSGGDDQGSGFRLTFSSGTLTASADVVYLRLHASGGSLVTVDVVGLNFTPPVDGLDLAIGFDPSLLEAVSVSDTTFLGECGRTRPDNTILLCADSISSGSANVTGALLFSAVPQGLSPAPATVSGDVVLATVTFRARSRGTSPLFFHDAAHPAPGGSVSRVTSDADPTGAAAVAFEPDGPGSVDVEIRR